MPSRPRAQSNVSDFDDVPGVTSTPSKRLSRRERDREEELRQQLKEEIEELKAAKKYLADCVVASSTNYPSRELTSEELQAVTQSDEFVDFLDKSTKVIERAFDQETYDILTDYALQGQDHDDEDDEAGNTGGRGRHRGKEVTQFYDERWSKKVSTFLPNSASSCSLPTPRTRQRRMSQTVWCWSGTHTCTSGPSTCSRLNPMFWQPNSLPIILTLSLVGHTVVRSYFGTQEQSLLLCRRHR